MRAVVLAGAGKAFCAGHDLKEMRAEPSLGYYQRLFAQCTRVMLAIQRLPVPVIARVQGIATAAGCQLVAMCDLAVAADDARFAVSGVNSGSSARRPSVALSRNVAAQGRLRDARHGRVHRRRRRRARGASSTASSRPSALDAEVESLVAAIVAKPRVAVAMGKELFYRQLEIGIEAAYEDAARTMACNMMEPSALEGRAGLHREARARLAEGRRLDATPLEPSTAPAPRARAGAGAARPSAPAAKVSRSRARRPSAVPTLSIRSRPAHGDGQLHLHQRQVAARVSSAGRRRRASRRAWPTSARLRLRRRRASARDRRRLRITEAGIDRVVGASAP